MFRWFVRRGLTRTEQLQLQLLRKVNYLMANWQDIKNDIQGLKEDVVRMFTAMEKMRGQLADALAKETLDPADVQSVHDDMVSLNAEIDHKLHADGM